MANCGRWVLKINGVAAGRTNAIDQNIGRSSLKMTTHLLSGCRLKETATAMLKVVTENVPVRNDGGHMYK